MYVDFEQTDKIRYTASHVERFVNLAEIESQY